MRFRLVAVGALDRALRQACDDYVARIKRYVRFELVEVGESKSIKDPIRARDREADAILKTLAPGERVVSVTRGGVRYDSREFAARLDQWQLDARDVSLLIGGASGFDARVLQRSDERVSLSSLTLPHDLARLFLLEQIYRSCTILRGEPYHRGP